ncbi:MAG TPA: helix-turn-helix transcriptional regulator, partial [Longimicrobiaceae bacterium]|nr:helix-turn-helix transcriptional regulator [Longimicrobiaceae bacterium]
MTTQGADWATRLRAIIDEFESGNQTAFAKQIGVSKQSVGKMLRGSTPSGSTLEELVRRYPVVNLEYLLTGRGPVRTPESRSGSAFERGAVEVVEQV